MEAPVAATTADHDLLIEVNTNVKNLASTLTTYTESNNRLNQDHETRIRALEASDQQNKGAQRSLKTQLAIISTVFGLVSIALAIWGFVRG